MSDKRLTFKKRLHILKHHYRDTKWAPAFNALHTFLYTPN
jgi:Na+-transporting NADH:ubiquinone oxidoreductase subunit B